MAAITPPTASTTAVTGSPLGTYPITLSGGSATNYDITLVNGTLEVIVGPWEDFETGTKGGYAIGTVTCKAGSWTFDDALLGNATDDRKNGSYSARIRNTGSIYTNFDLTTGVGTVTVNHAQYGGDGNSSWILEASTDGGATWTAYVSSVITASSTTLTSASFTLNLSGNVRLRITKQAGGGQRLNIDDIYVTSYAVPDINVLGNGVSIADASTATGVANHTEFAATPVNGSSTRTFTIQNSTGIGTINLTGTPNRVTVSGSSAFSVTTQPALSALTTGGNQSTTFVITFSPTNTLNQTATVTIVNDDPDALEQTYTFAISGTGTNSLASDIVVTSGFTYATNINYTNFIWNDIIPANSVVAGGFTLRDGGATTDADAEPTVLNAITFSLSNFANIQKVALYDGATEIQEVAGAATVTFSGLNLSTVTDGGTKNFTLRVTFNTGVTDNEQFQFAVTSATAAPSGSGFPAADAGGATTSVSGDNNRIEVTATAIAFGQQPTNASINVAMAPSVTVRTVDANGNVDVDVNTGSVAITSTGTLTGTPVTASITGGTATFASLTHTVAQTGRTLSATSGSYSAITSTTFDITTIVYVNGDYRSIASNTWLSNNATAGLWERLVSGVWTASNSPAYNTSNNVYIQNGTVVTTGGSFGSSVNIKVMDGGTFNCNHSGTAANMYIYNNGILNVNASFTMASGGTFEVENGGTVNLNFSYGTPATSIWAGTENFAPQSNLVIQNWDFANDFLIPNNTAIATNTYNGYTACFGNVIIDAGSNTTTWIMLASGTTVNLAHGNLEFLTNTGNVSLTTTGTVTSGIGGDFYVDDAYAGSHLIQFKTSGTLNFTIKGDMILDQGTTRIAAGTSVTSVVNIEGDLNILSSGFLEMQPTISGTSSQTINLKGDLLVVGSGRLSCTNSANAANNNFNFTGTGDGLTPATTQTIDVASTATLENSGIFFNVNSGAYVQLINRDFELGNNSKLTVNNGGVFDFGFSGTTPLNLMVSGSQTGMAFQTDAGSTIKITSTNGITASAASGNVQVPARTYDVGAYYQYIGKANQVTGEGLPTTLTNGRLIVDMNTATLNLNLTASTAINGGQLGLVRGLLLLDDKNITLNATATVTGTPSASNMVVTNSTGQFFKTYSAASSFTYPLGDNTGTIEYSPVALTFTGAVSGNVGARVTDAVHPNMGTVSNYLSRYWSFTNTLSNYNYTAVFTYPAADAVGTMTNVKASRYSGSGTTWSSISGSSATTTALTITTSQTETTSPLTSDYTGREACVVGTWTGAQNTLWENVNNWSCLTVPTSTIDVTIPNVTNDPVITGTVVANTRNISVEAGALFTIDGEVSIYGNFSNAGSGVSGQGIVRFTGSAAQTISGDFTVEEVEINNNNGVSLLTGSDVNLTRKLTLTLGTLTTTNGNMVLKSNNTRTAYVDDFNDATGVTNSNTGITGNLTIERYIKPTAMLNYTGRFHYIGGLTSGSASKWSDDFSNAATSADNVSVTPKPTCDPEQLEFGSAYGNLLSFDESVVTDCNLKGWKVRTTAATADRGKGFAAQINGGVVIDETGGYSNASLTLNTLSITGNNMVGAGVNAQNLNNSKGEHLVANPFWAPLDWNKVTGTGLDGTAYRYNPNTGTFNPFNTISGSNVFSTNEAFVILPTSGARNAVAPGNTGTYSINFPATARVNSSNNEMLRSQQPYAYAMKVKVAANGEGDETLIAFDNTFTESYDDAKDAKKLMSSVGVPSLYTLDPSDRETRCILALPEATAVKTIPLSVRPQYNGIHEFTFEGLSDFPNTSIVWLEDLTTGTIQYLKQNNTYSFTANKTDNADRFLLHFAPEMVITATQANCVNENGSISLEERGGLEWSYELVDNNNATVSQNANFSGNQTIAQLPSGTYSLNLVHAASGYQTTETVTIQQVATVAATLAVDNTTVNAGDMVTVDISNTTGATNTTVDMGDGTVYNNESLINHIYTGGGTYTVTLNANNDNCSDAASLQIRVEELTTGISNTETKGINVNANANELYIEQLLEKGDVKVKVDIYNMLGQIVTSMNITATYKVPATIILTDVAKGTYIAQVTAGKKTVSKRIVVSE